MQLRRPFLLLALGLALTACGGKEEILEPAPLPDLQPQVKVVRDWSADTGDGGVEAGLALQPAVTGDAVYVADVRGRVTALGRAKGDRRWVQKLDVPVSAGPVAAYNQVFVGTREGEVIALAAGDGQVLWRTALGGEVLAAPAINGDALAVKSTDGRIQLLDRATGVVRWSYDGGSPPLALRAASRPLLLDDAVLAGLPSGLLVALERSSGSVIWERRVADPSGKSELDRLVDIAGDFVLRDERVYVATYQGRLVALDLRSGQFAWQLPVSTWQAVATDGEAVYVVDTDSRVLAVRASDGLVLWRLESLLRRGLTGVAVAGDWLVAGDYAGKLHVIRRSDGVLVGRGSAGLFADAAYGAPPVVDEDRVYVLDSAGRLAALRLLDRAAPAAGDAAP